MKKAVSVILAFSLVLLLAFCVSAEATMPKMEQGTINSSDGKTRFEITRIRTADFLELEKYSGVSINDGYEMTNFVYDANLNYLGTSSWLGSGTSFTTEFLKLKYPEGVYFKLAIRSVSQDWLLSSNANKTGVTFYLPNEDMPEQKGEVIVDPNFPNESVMSVGAWQEGAIFNKRLFLFNHSGNCAIYDLEQKQLIGSLQLDKNDAMSPHANSVCFGTEYYTENDKYPLLYVNVYNNYKNEIDRREGTCCVYRIVEENGAFSSQLVQIIKIGFVEDLSLWKSQSNNGDVRPYGNFVVDTDNNKLYAFVMRDATQTTRFFKFNLPLLSDGIYNEEYACNVVTLESSDIEDSFDTVYFNYIQGCDYVYGKIVSAEGFNPGGGAEPAVRVIDLASKKLLATYHPAKVGIVNEPEVVAVDRETNKVYYAATDGKLRILSFMDEYKPEEKPEEPIDPPINPEQPENPPVNPEQPENPPVNPEQPENPPVNPEEPEDKPTDTPEDVPVVTEPTLIKGDDGVWRYFVNGEWDQTATTLHKLNGKWFYVEDGIWSKASRLVEYKGVIFYVKGGKWDKTLADTLYKIEGNWYYIVDGKLAVNETTMVKYKSKWFYVEEGELSLTSRFVNYKGVIFYIKGGKWDKTLNTLIKKDGKYVAVKSGKKYIGKAIIEYKGKNFYVNKGYAQLSYSGKVTIDGKKYTIKGGKVV